MKTSHDCIPVHVWHLASWPPESLLVQDSGPHLTRICALLARRPSVGMAIPVLLEIPAQTVHFLLETLQACGHIYSADTLESGQAALPEAAPAGLYYH
ncbi:MAG: hypothetical protein M3R45_02380 [Pseudomonadota bacterium]|nr:hypothetical protein [Pseudomonadota bacterium]